MSEGKKHDEGKLKWSYLPFKSIEMVVRVLMFGAKKYKPRSWQNVPDGRARYIDAALRHITEDIMNESQAVTLDKESGLPTLAHAACCLLFVIWFDMKRTREILLQPAPTEHCRTCGFRMTTD